MPQQIRDLFDPKVTKEEEKAKLPVFSVRIGHDGPCNVHASSEDRAVRVMKDAFGIRSTEHEAEVYEGPTKVEDAAPKRPTNPKTGKPFEGPVGPIEREILRKQAQRAADEE